jgi:hypothetical protein
MSFYIGTKYHCEQYDTRVSDAEKYVPPTSRWFEPLALNNGQYAVMAHPDYSSTMQKVETLDGYIDIPT